MSRFPVGVNLLWLVPGVVGGSESYTVRLLRAVAEAAPADLDLTLFVNGRFPAAHPDLVDGFRTVAAPVDGSSKPRRVLAETTWLGREVRRRGIGAVHHAGGTAPAWQPVPTILTMHDLQPLRFPEHFSRQKRTFIRLVVPPSVRRATAITVLSASTRDDLVHTLGADRRRITVVPPGFDPPIAAGDAERRREVVRHRYDLGDRPFFVYPAITYPHKNHELLVRAFAEVVARRDDALLVLPGGSAQCEGDVVQAVGDHGLGGHVRRVGRVSDDDLDVLYREAVALTFPSRYEGFGIPVLEAMSRDCPVIAAAGTALPEVVGDAGLLVDPDDAGAWSAAMVGLLEDPARRGVLVDAGRQRATAFDWARSAQVQADVYRSVRDGGPTGEGPAR